ncbi:MAG: hypothetical protein Q9225_002361 [Loekoesia sp. 1 TL-2023]
MRRRSRLSSLVLLLVATSLPFTHARRATYPSDYATCVNASADLDPVTVKPYCDNAISTVCSTAVSAIAASSNLSNYKAVGIPPNFIGACEVDLLFFEPRPTFNFTYETCVHGFQSITIDCMLIGYGKHAGDGHQSGVRGVVYDPQGNESSLSNPVFSALEAASPGFLVGAPLSYGNISAEDLTASVPENVFPQEQ